MNVFGVLFWAELIRRLRSRAFVAGTLVGAAGIVLISILPSLLGGMAAGAEKRIVLAGDPAITAEAARLLRRDFEITATLPAVGETPTAAFLDAHGKASAVAILTRASDGLHVTVYARDPSAFRGAFARDLAPIQVALATGVPVAQVQQHSRVPVDVHDVSGRFASANAADAAKGIAYLFVMLLYIGILLNAQSIMTSVAEEKTSRIAELLVAMVEPARLLSAKICAAVVTGLVQLGLWVITGMLAGRELTTIYSSGDASAAPVFGTLDVSAGEIVALVAFFVVGFAQYGVMYAAAASLINRTEDLGSVAGPLVIPVVAGIVIAQFGLQFPNSTNIVVCSFVPLISPFVMFTRIAVTNVPAWQIVVSLALNLATAVLLAYLAGKIYRVGLLMYGRAPSLRQVIATLRS